MDLQIGGRLVERACLFFLGVGSVDEVHDDEQGDQEHEKGKAVFFHTGAGRLTNTPTDAAICIGSCVTQLLATASVRLVWIGCRLLIGHLRSLSRVGMEDGRQSNTSARNHRQRDVGRVIGIVVDGLVGDGYFGVGGYRVAAIEVAVVAGEVRARYFDSNAVSLFEHV